MADRSVAKQIDRPDASVVGEIVSAEFNNQVVTARKYPRDEVEALANLQKLACRSDAVAESCMYTLKRKDKNGQINYITGPSVRFAELLAHAWGNLRAGARIVDEGEKAVVAQGVAYDLQRNTGFSVEVRRGIVTSSGSRFGSDMVNVTSNAACSIALRNAIFDCIPQALWSDVYDAVKHKAIGAAAIPERLQKAVQFFVSKGATQEDVLKAMGVKAIADMGRQHLEIFIGLTTALKEGAIDAAKIFTEEGAEQRERLTLVASDDPADPGVPGTPIDRVMEKAKEERDAKATEKKGGSPKKAAPKAVSDGGRTPAAEETKPADAKEATPAEDAASSSPPADESDADQAAADREDEALVASVEAKLDPAKAMSSRKVVNENRGALARVAEMGADPVKARAAKILQDWPAK